MLRYHGFYIGQGEAGRHLLVQDLQEDAGKSASGVWRHDDHALVTDDDDVKTIIFTSASRTFLRWRWSFADAQTLSLGTEFQRASHKTGEEKPVHDPVILLYGVTRDSAGLFGPKAKFREVSGRGRLANGAGPFKAGEIAWTVKSPYDNV